MPPWFDRLKERILRARSEVEAPIDEAPTSPYRDSVMERPPTTPPPKPTPTLANALWRLGPYVVLGIGLAMTIFAERLRSWAILGFLLLASAPILFALRRIEELLKELVETNKIRRR